MTIVLLNTTPIVHKIVEKLAQKRGDLLFESETPDGSSADAVIVDDSMRDACDAAQARTLGLYTLFLGSRFDAMPEGFDAVVSKPFLPEELFRALDDAEVSLAGVPEEGDLYDADEAAVSWLEPESDIADHPEEGSGVFNDEDIDEVKQLLDAFDSDAEEREEEKLSVSELENKIAAALERMDEAEWEQPYGEVLYDAQSMEKPESATHSDDADPFAGMDLHARGVEALQDLMAILSDESVARALKAMGVRIDISFGEKV